MKKNTLIVLAVIGGIMLIGLGFYCGLSYTKKEISKIKTESSLTSLFSSKVISGGLTAVAVGQIKEISGRNLVISAEGNDLTVSVKEGAAVNRLTSAGGGSAKVPQPATMESIKFEDIKIGDKVNVFCNLKTDLSLEGASVTIMP